MKRARILRKVTSITDNKLYSRCNHLTSSNTCSKYGYSRYSVVNIRNNQHELISSRSGDGSNCYSVAK